MRDEGCTLGQHGAMGAAASHSPACDPGDDLSRDAVNACKILKLPFTGAIGILLRMREKELTSEVETLRKLEILRKYGRYRAEIVDDVRRRLEAKK